jgi:aldose sugar dehydrogenase
MLRLIGVLLSCAVLTACGGSDDSAPPSGQPPGGTPITGNEKLGWSQTANDASDLATFHYAIYVDNVRSELASASCTPPSGTSASCLAPLPPMSQGAHTLELAAFVLDGANVLESVRSTPLAVFRSSAVGGPAGPLTAWPSQTLATQDGVRLRLEQIADNVIAPTDLAFAPDGRLFVAEHDGRVRVVRDGRLLDQPALSLPDTGSTGAHLLALALDPQFDRTGLVYAVYSTPARSGARTFSIARFREVANTLADQIVLRDDIPASSTDEAASLRVGADGKLFAAFDDGGTVSLADDLASPNGKILRLNLDGTTPRDQAGGAPLYSYPYRSPRGLDWQPDAKALWIADRSSSSSAHLSVVVEGGSQSAKRGVVRSVIALPGGTLPSSVAFGHGNSLEALRNNLLVASDEGRHLLRIQLDPRDSTHVLTTERLLQDQIGGIRLVAVAPDGSIYLGTANAIGRLISAN